MADYFWKTIYVSRNLYQFAMLGNHIRVFTPPPMLSEKTCGGLIEINANNNMLHSFPLPTRNYKKATCHTLFLCTALEITIKDFDDGNHIPVHIDVEV